MHALLLKLGATALTIATAVVAAIHVSSSVKNQSAPLHPMVLGQPAAASTPVNGSLSLSPSVRRGDVQPVTSTHAS
jgi:hypothetical protein